MAEYQHQIRLGFCDGKWRLVDERIWYEVEDFDGMMLYLKNMIKIAHEGEIVLRKKGNKWYMRDVTKAQNFSTADEMYAAFQVLEKNYQDEVLNSFDSLTGKRKVSRGIDMGRLQTYMKVAPEEEQKEVKKMCAWHPEAEMVVICAGCEKRICEKCIGKQIDEENTLCNSCWTQYKYSRHLEKFKKMK